MDKIFDLIKREPIMAASIIQSLLGLIAAFGVGLTADQVAAVMVFTNTTFGFIARAYVTPNHIVAEKVEVALNTPAPPKSDDSPMDQLK